MNKFFTLLIAAVALFNGASAFTVSRPMTTSHPMTQVLTPTQSNKAIPGSGVSTVSTARYMFIDPNIPEIASQPLGSIIMLIGIVSLWEVITPGRAKKG